MGSGESEWHKIGEKGDGREFEVESEAGTEEWFELHT